MNRSALLLRTPAVTLSRFDHPPGASHSDPEFESSRVDSINIVESGAFAIRMQDTLHNLVPGAVFVAARGMEFQCTHDCEVPTDSCLSVAFSDETVEDLLSADIPALKPPFAHVTRREQFLHHRLNTCAPGDEVRLDLLAGALFESIAAEGTERAPHIPAINADVSRRIQRAIDLAEHEYGRVLSLDDLASAANMSAFHFARVFRELTGLPPHRYLTAIRLYRAAQMLDAGASVSLTCMETGFGSLSHFINAFRKRYGMLPSDIKRGFRVPRVRASLSSPVWSRRTD